MNMVLNMKRTPKEIPIWSIIITVFLHGVQLIGLMHEFPKCLEMIFPRFNPDKSFSLKDHRKNFYLVVNLMNIEHKEIVCRLFPYTFENEEFTWYYNLPAVSIRRLDEFDRGFLNEFGEEKTPATLLREPNTLKTKKKEKIKDFNQHFAIILKNIYVDVVPTK